MFSRSHITAIGSSLLDIFFFTNEAKIHTHEHDKTCLETIGFEVGAKIVGSHAERTYGGGASNASITFANFGLRPRLISSVGDDAIGHDYMRYLEMKHVNVRQTPRNPRALTGMSLLLNTPEHKHVAFVLRGASELLSLHSTIRYWKGSPWIYVTSLSGGWKKNLQTLFDNKTESKIVWNPGNEQISAGITFLRRYMKYAHLFMVNQDEATELLMSVDSKNLSNNPRTMIKSLHRYGQAITIITAGHKGSYLFDGSRIYYQKAILKKTKNKAGAGDAFGSGVTTGLIRFKSIERAMKLGAYNSSAVVGHVGAQTGILHERDLHRLKI